MQVHYFINKETIIVIWHLIKRHKQLPGWVMKWKLAYMQLQDVTGRTVSQVKMFNMIQTSNIVLFQEV